MVFARNIVPDTFLGEYIINGSIKTITNAAGLSILNVDITGGYKPSVIDGSTIYYPEDTDTSKYSYSISNISNQYVTVMFSDNSNYHVGPLAVSAYTVQTTCDWTGTCNYLGSTNTPIDKDINIVTLTDNVKAIILKCNPTQTGGVVETVDQIYSLDRSIISYTLTKISGDVDIVWLNSKTTISNQDDFITVVVKQYVTTYSKIYTISKTFRSSNGSDVLAVTIDSATTYKPYFNSQIWPFDIDQVIYTIVKDGANVVLHFENGTKINEGPANIYADVAINIGLFRKSVILSGNVYDYEFLQVLYMEITTEI